MTEEKLDQIVKGLQTISQTDARAREVIFAKIDHMVEVQVKQGNAIAIIQTQLRYIPSHDTPCEPLTEHIKAQKRPCSYLEKHIDGHKDAKVLWQRPIIGTVIDLIKMAIVFAVATFWAKR